jgi:hypothetical protein
MVDMQVRSTYGSSGDSHDNIFWTLDGRLGNVPDSHVKGLALPDYSAHLGLGLAGILVGHFEESVTALPDLWQLVNIRKMTMTLIGRPPLFIQARLVGSWNRTGEENHVDIPTS